MTPTRGAHLQRRAAARPTAVFSPDREYRYLLERSWPEGTGWCMFIGLNPSTADETSDDPTVRRCISFAKLWGYRGLLVGNIFAYRATDPKVMEGIPDPVGPYNDSWLKVGAARADLIVCAWGVHGRHRFRDEHVLDLLSGHDLKCLGVTKDGYPLHPLYLAKKTKTLPYSELDLVRKMKNGR